MKNNVDSSWICENCGKSFSRKDTFVRHRNSFHDDSSEERNSFICESCGQIFRAKYNLNRHFVRVHSNIENNSFTCGYCNREFSRKLNLISHIRTHIEITCAYCNKTFRSEKKLSQHIQCMHSPEENGEQNIDFTCAHCNKTFRVKKYLSLHIYRMHFPKENANQSCKFECSQCLKIFTHKKNLARHIHSIHSLQRQMKLSSLANKYENIKCLLCGIKYPTRKELRQHYEMEHNLNMQPEHLKFISFEEFIAFKPPEFRLQNNWRTSVDNVKMFWCRRSGVYQDSCEKRCQKRKRSLKLVGSKKLQGFCPAQIILRQKKCDGTCLVTYHKFHVGHSVDDMEEEDYRRIIVPEMKKKLKTLRKRHRVAEKYLENVFIEPLSNETWQLSSCHSATDKVLEKHVITKVQGKECSSHSGSCVFHCKLCNSCFHEYQCTCSDYAIHSNMCKHIHALCIFLQKRQCDSPAITVFTPNQSMSVDVTEPINNITVSAIDTDIEEMTEEIISPSQMDRRPIDVFTPNPCTLDILADATEQTNNLIVGTIEEDIKNTMEDVTNKLLHFLIPKNEKRIWEHIKDQFVKPIDGFLRSIENFEIVYNVVQELD